MPIYNARLPFVYVYLYIRYRLVAKKACTTTDHKDLYVLLLPQLNKGSAFALLHQSKRDYLCLISRLLSYAYFPCLIYYLLYALT